MICDKLMEEQDLTKVYGRGGERRGIISGKEKQGRENIFKTCAPLRSCIRVSRHPQSTGISLPHQVRPPNYYFQKPSPKQVRVLSHDGVHLKCPHTTYSDPREQKHSSWNENLTVLAHKLIQIGTVVGNGPQFTSFYLFSPVSIQFILQNGGQGRHGFFSEKFIFAPYKIPNTVCTYCSSFSFPVPVHNTRE